MPDTPGPSCEPLPTQVRDESSLWCRRTADAALQDLDIIHSRYPGRMLILVAGHHYKMDYDVMIETNLSNQARFTVGCAEVPARDAALPSSPTDSHDH